MGESFQPTGKSVQCDGKTTSPAEMGRAVGFRPNPAYLYLCTANASPVKERRRTAFPGFLFLKKPTMYILLISIVIGLFVAMLFLNVYFRVKVLKSYKILVRNQVEFGAAHVFNRERREQEILPRYPEMRQEIETFSNYLRYSIRMASVLIALITLFGAILMYFR
jgi:hypothetical protein